MAWEGWVVLGVIGLVLGLLIHGRIGADVIIVAGVSLLVLLDVLLPGSRILSTDEALSGMANSGMITVAVMYVVVAGLTETGAVAWLASRLLGKPKSVLSAQLRMLIPVAGLSAFMNNTPLVAMFIPILTDWSKRYKISPSKLMMPLSYAAIMGGTCTLMGTSTNLVVSGKWDETMVASGAAKPIGFLDVAWLGVPCTIAGIIMLMTVGRRLLPERKAVLSVQDDPRSYTLEMVVDPAGPLVGKTIEAAGLRHLDGLFLAEIQRGDQVLAAVGPEERLAPSDRLVFVGVIDSIVDLKKIRGLAPATNQVVKLDAPRPQRCLIEAVVSKQSPLLGLTIKEGRFRSVYNAVVIAVARAGERLNTKLGDIELRAGDTLLLEAHRSFVEQHRNSRDFLLVSRVENSTPVRHERSAMALLILLGTVLVGSFNPFGLGMIHAAVLGAGLMLLTKCCNASQARRSVDWQVLVTIAASGALATAMENSGAAAAIAGFMVGLAGNDPFMTLVIVFALTMIFTEIITNNAAAQMMFAIALAAAEALGVDFKPYALCIMVAASCCFSTPIGYQTNLMVMSPGGYKFSDYFRVGIPMNITMAVVCLTAAYFFYPIKALAPVAAP